MTNLLYSLPQELITEIYEYDSTYHNMEPLFNELKSKLIFKNVYNKKYIIIDLNLKMMSIDNKSMHNPIFVIPFCDWSYNILQRKIRNKKLELVYPMDNFFKFNISFIKN